MRSLVLAIVLSLTAACSPSGEDSAIDIDSGGVDSGGVDGGVDTGFAPCGSTSCCCKDGSQTGAACGADGAGACEEGWTYHDIDCKFQLDCFPLDSSVDVRTDSDDTGTRDGDAPHE